MSSQYSHTRFFRLTPNALLARYFQQHHQVIQELAFDKLKESDITPIFEAFKTLPEEKQTTLEAELQDIDSMACQGGITALTDEAAFYKDTNFPISLASIEGFHGKALWTFLEHKDYWYGGSFLLRSDTIAESFWKRRNDLPHIKPTFETAAIQHLEQTISDYFYRKQGRGRNCKVEIFHRFDKVYFFAYPEDFAQSAIEWVRNALKSQAHHPAFEIIFVYKQSEGSLDIYAPRNTKYISNLQAIFAQCILKIDDLDPFASENKTYQLDALADRQFTFKIDANSGIEKAAISLLRLSLLNGKQRRVTIQADPSHDSTAIYDLMESLNLPNFHVSQVELQITFSPLLGKQTRTRKVKISHPNWCGLKHDGEDELIRHMLVASGIVPIKLAVDE